MGTIESDFLEPRESPSSPTRAQEVKDGVEKRQPDDATDSAASGKPERAAETDADQPTTGISAAPEGGLRAWLVVVGSGFIFFSCLGFVNTFGVFQQYYTAHQLRDHTPDNIAWIGALTAFVQSGAGAITGPLFDRFGAWVSKHAFPRPLLPHRWTE